MNDREEVGVGRKRMIRRSRMRKSQEGRALRQFTLSTGKSAGRNSSGRITLFHRGGGSKRRNSDFMPRRSIWKGSFLDAFLLRMKKSNLLNRKIWSRRSSISPEFVDSSVRIYNGKTLVRCIKSLKERLVINLESLLLHGNEDLRERILIGLGRKRGKSKEKAPMAQKGNPISVRLDLNRSSDSSLFSRNQIKKILINSLVIPIIMCFLFNWDWGWALLLVQPLVDFFSELFEMKTLRIGGEGGDAGPSRRPALDLNGPPAPEPALDLNQPPAPEPALDLNQPSAPEVEAVPPSNTEEADSSQMDTDRDPVKVQAKREELYQLVQRQLQDFCERDRKPWQLSQDRQLYQECTQHLIQGLEIEPTVSEHETWLKELRENPDTLKTLFEDWKEYVLLMHRRSSFLPCFFLANNQKNF